MSYFPAVKIIDPVGTVLKVPKEGESSALSTDGATPLAGVDYTSGTPLYKFLRADKITGALANIDVVHFKIHSGDSYTFSETFSIASSTTYKYAFKINAKAAHMRWLFNCSGADMAVTLYENPTITDWGVAQVEKQRNRVSSNTATLEAFKTVVTSASGTQLYVRRITAGQIPAIDNNDEWILKTSEDYLVSIYSYGTGTATIMAHWYEE